MERLFGTLELRSTDDELREFEGVANTATMDAHGTCILPAGARFSLPLPLLFHHDQQTPVGEITEARMVDGKWHVKGFIRKIAESGFVKDITDRAWHNVKYQLMRGLSIGFKPLKSKGNQCLEWSWRELSIVTIPSNQDANIIAVRSAFGASADTPGVSGTATKPNPNNKPRHQKMNLQEQILQFQNTRAAKVAQRDAVLETVATKGETLDEGQQQEFDTLDSEIRSIDATLSRLETSRKDLESRAVPVNGTSSAAASQSRAGVLPVVSIESRAGKGIPFARYVMSLAATRGDKYAAERYAKDTFGDEAGTQVSQMVTRAAVAAGTTTNATFAAPLIKTNFVDDFLELLRPLTLVDRIPGTRRVPFNTSMPAQTAGGTYKWVGEGKPKPLTNAQFAAVTLGRAKASGIIVLTEELVRSSAPSAQEAVRDEMLKGVTQFLDGQFIDSTVAAVANVNPASITNGVAGTAASGTDAAAALADIRARVAAFAAANFGLAGLVILMSESVAFTLGTMLDTNGNPAFPGLGVNGGSILGIPVVTSQTVGAQIVFAHTPSILIADEGGVEIDISREASVQMDSAPTDPPDATTIYTSFWQMNLVGIRAERFITWGKARATAVDRITGVAYA